MLRKEYALGLSLLISSAHAQIVQFDFLDTKHQPKTVVSGTDNLLNPQGETTVFAVAGLDRKIRLNIKNSSNADVYTNTSNNITVADRFTSSTGAGFYGAKFIVPALGDGSYTATSTVLDSNGGVISVNSYKIVMDSTPPSIGGEFAYSVGGLTYGSIGIFGSYQPNIISIGNITDNLSGIASASYFAIDSDGKKRSLALNINTAISPTTASIDSKTASSATVCPTDQATYTIGVDITDKAGNITTKSRVSQIDRTVPPAEFEVWNSATSTWMPYSSAVSYENPIKFRKKIKLEYLTTINGTNFGFPYSPSYKDDTFGYWDSTIAIPTTGSNYTELQTLSGSNRTFYYSNFNNVTLAGTAEAGPVLVSSSYAKQNGDVISGTTVNVATPTVFDRYTVTLQARSYNQLVTLNNQSCTVPAGETDCTIDPKISITSGRGYNPYPLYIKNLSNSVVVRPTYFYTYWDMNPPVINQFSLSEITKSVFLQVVDNDRVNNWQLGMWNTTNFSVRALKKDGTTIALTLTNSTDEDYKTKDRTYSVASLPEGEYDLIATAVDTYNNTATQTISGYTIDNTPPTITLTGVSGGSISKLGDIQFTVTDTIDPEPIIKSISLSGGPIGDTLSLGFNKQSDGYHLESPRMFPSLDSTQTYTLTIVAKDNQNNQATYKQTFFLTPENLVALGTIKGLAVNKILLDKSDKPLTYAQITTVKTSAGATATGEQQAYFTLRRDAKFAVVVNGVTVQPGETKNFTLNLDNTGGAVLPIYPAVSGTTGDAAFIIDVPQLVSN